MDLEDYRKEIDRVNAEIADAVSRRMNVVDEIKKYKEENGMDTVDQDREEKVKKQFEKLFEREELPREKGRDMAELLIDMAVDRQEDNV